MRDMDLYKNTDTVNELLARYGVKFGIYKNNEFKEQLFPFDAVPRVIGAEEFVFLERGLKQRVTALNLFIRDIYGEKKIIRDKVVPEEFIYASSGYLAQCEGVLPPKGIYTHIAGIDLVQGKDGSWYILEDNLRVPSGASYPMIARELCRRSSPRTFQQYHIEDNRNYARLLRKTMDYVNTGGHTVVLTPGRYNAAYFEHSYLAEKTGAHLVTGNELLVENDHLYYIDYSGRKERVGAVYRRISDEYLDPMNFCEEPVLQNAPTYLPLYPEDMCYVLEHFDDLVLKDVAEAGGYGVVFGSKMTKAEKENFITLLKREPRRFIAQEVIDFVDLDIMEGNELVPRKADLRAFVLLGEEPMVWKSGLTRFSRRADSFIVNSSQGGGFKDAWVLSQ